MKRSLVHKVILPMMLGNYPSSQNPNFIFCLHVDSILFSDFPIYFYVVLCIRCLWQTSAFASPDSTNPPIQNDRELDGSAAGLTPVQCVKEDGYELYSWLV